MRFVGHSDNIALERWASLRLERESVEVGEVSVELTPSAPAGEWDFTLEELQMVHNPDSNRTAVIRGYVRNNSGRDIMGPANFDVSFISRPGNVVGGTEIIVYNLMNGQAQPFETTVVTGDLSVPWESYTIVRR